MSTCTVISGLSVARLAPALVRPVCVDAQLLTNVLASSALVQVSTSGVVGIQHESGGTAARVAAFQILTRHFARGRVQQAFVYICGTCIFYKRYDLHVGQNLSPNRTCARKIIANQTVVSLAKTTTGFCLPLQCVPV
jgi:hypothetical protein